MYELVREPGCPVTSFADAFPKWMVMATFMRGFSLNSTGSDMITSPGFIVTPR